MNASNPATVAAPAIGVHRNVPFATYKAWPAVNSTSLKPFIAGRVPARCWWENHKADTDTPAKLVGRALHVLALEGEVRYAEAFAVAEQCAAVVKSTGEPCTNQGSILGPGFKWYCKTKGHAPKGFTAGRMLAQHVLTADQASIVRGMHAGLMSNDAVRGFIEGDGDNELSLVWEDAETGLLCKARLDMLRPDWNAVGDLKKIADDVAEAPFLNTIRNYGYAAQGAFYLRGAYALQLGVEHFAIAAVEEEKPHFAAGYTLKEDSLAYGDAQVGKALAAYAACKERDEWPAYGGFREITLPQWLLNKDI